ncbi:MAG: hypothetical protein RIS70_991 [Planctomycetota bacterium]
MIRIERLSKHYGSLKVLDDISTEIHRGEVISIIGPSGTGKSTFLRCLNLLEHPTSGSIWIDGVNLLDKNTDVPKLRQKMNMVFQSFNLFAHLSVMENLTLGPIKLRGIARTDAERKAIDLLRLVGLAEKVDSFPDELSGGQKQRVAIARCLAMEPEVILFDEPTSALDPTMVGEVLPVIRRLAREGMTMAIVTHEMDFARDVANRVFYMDEGGIYEQGPPDQVFEHPEREKTRSFIKRIRCYNHRITSPDYDLYALNAEVAAFCEKHVVPRQVRDNVVLAIEEMLQLYHPVLQSTPLDLSIGYSEKTQDLDLTWESVGEPSNPLENEQLPDSFGLNIIHGLTESVNYQRNADRNRVSMRMRKL